jgi:predicted peptidase
MINTNPMKYLFSLAMMVVCLSGLAQDLELFQRKTFVSTDGKKLLYRILYPENYDSTKKYPLVLFLHGAGERGNDNEKQLTHGAKLFVTDENRKKFPAIVIFPQCAEESYWSTVKIDRTKTPIHFDFDYSRPASSDLSLTIALVKSLLKKKLIDKKRVYVMGLSMGGMGTFEIVFREPKLFAAAVPICGGGDVKHYDKRIKKTSFHVFHGEQDAVVNVNQSREMVEKIKQQGGKVVYKEYPNVNHNSWDNAFAEPDFLSWVFGK